MDLLNRSETFSKESNNPQQTNFFFLFVEYIPRNGEFTEKASILSRGLPDPYMFRLVGVYFKPHMHSMVFQNMIGIHARAVK